MSKKEFGIQAGKALSMLGQGIAGEDVNSTGAILGRIGADVNDARLAAMVADEQEKRIKKQQKGKTGGAIGSAIGSVVGSLIPGVGTVLGAGLGSALGSAGGQAIAGGKVNVGDAIQAGITGGVTAGVAPSIFGKLGLDSLTKLNPAIQGLMLQQAGPLILGSSPGSNSLVGAITQKSPNDYSVPQYDSNYPFAPLPYRNPGL